MPEKPAAPSTDPAYERTRLLISYPIPFDGLEPDRLGNLRIPKDLTQDEADRVKAMIDTLVLARAEATDA